MFLSMSSIFSPSQAAGQSGFSPGTLRYCEPTSLLDGIGCSPSGHRRFCDDDLTWLGVPRCPRDTGMPIAQMRSRPRCSRRRSRRPRSARSAQLLELVAQAPCAYRSAGRRAVIQRASRRWRPCHSPMHHRLDCMSMQRRPRDGRPVMPLDRAALGSGHDRVVVPVRRRAHADVCVW